MGVLTAAVVGLGQIGQGYDYAIQDGSKILTHASAFSHHPAYHLVAGVDADPEKRNQFEKKFQCPSYPDIKSLYADKTPDVLALAVPTAVHGDVFHEIAAYSPKAILCEKPIAHNLYDAQEILNVAAEKQIVLAVNYMRRFEPGVARIKQLIRDAAVGEVYKIIGHYTKGILNNGSHLIDLLKFIFGEFDELRIIKAGRKWQGLDPEPDVYCRIGNIDIYLIAGKEEFNTRFDIEIIGTKGTINYGRAGKLIELHRIKSDPIFSQYHFLADEGEIIPNDYWRYQWHVVDNLYFHLTDGASLCSSGASAFSTLVDIFKIIDQLKEGD